MTAINNDTLGRALIVIGKRIKAGRCEVSQEQMEVIFRELESSVDVPVSKEEACSILGISRASFDAKVLSGIIPQGKHRRGFKEKVWYRRELTNGKVVE